MLINSSGVFRLGEDAGTAQVAGVLSGSGILDVGNIGGSGSNILLTNTANTFTGGVLWSAGNNGGFDLSVNSFLDSASPGAGNLVMGFGGVSSTQTFTVHTGAVAPMSFTNRQFELVGSASGITHKIANNSTQAFTISSDLNTNNATGTKTLNIGGTGTGLSTFAGDITNGGLTTLNLTKADSGTWALSGTNTYNGATAVSAGTLIVSGTGSTNTGAYTLTNAAILRGTTPTAFGDTTNINLGGTSTLQLRGDSTATFGKTTGGAAYTTSITATGTTINVDRNTVAGTNQTFTLGAMTISSVAATVNTTLSGANNTSLILGAVTDTSAAGGTVQFTNNIVGGGSLTLGSFAGTRTGTPTLQFSGAGNTTVTGNITQTGTQALTYNGTGILTLGGTNSYTGITTVNTAGGLLRVNGNSSAATGAVAVSAGALGGSGSLGGAVTVSGTGGINLADGSVGNLSLGSTLAITGAAGANSLTFDLGNATDTTDQILVSGATSVTNAGAGVIRLNQLGGLAGRNTAGNYTLINGTTTMAALSQFALETTRAYGQTFALSLSGDDLVLTTTHAASGPAAAFWKGGDNNWSTTTNWNTDATSNIGTGAAPGYQTNVTFATTTPTPGNLTTNVLDTDFDINSLNFNSLTGGVTIGGTKTLTIEATNANGNTAGNGITSANTSGINTISAKVLLAAAQTWTTAAGGTLTINAATNLNGNALTIAGSGTTNINGVATNVISGAGGITVNGSRFVIGSGGSSPTHTYSGDTTLTGGATLLFNGNFSANSNINLNGGVIESYWTGGFSRTIGTGATQIRITGGESGFAMNGSNGATFTLGALTWGDTNFNPTKLLLQNANSQGTSALTLASAINLNGANRTIVAHQGLVWGASSTISGNITNSTGTAGLIKEGFGLLTLTGASNTYNGGTTISAGTLAFDKIDAMPSTGAVAVNNATLGVDVGAAGDWTGGTSGVGTLGGLLAGVGGAGTSTVTYTGNVGLRLNLTGNTTFSGDIADVGTTLALTKVGGSTLTLSGNNSYSGGTSLQAGTLSFGSNTALGTGTLAISDGTSLQSDSSSARTLTNAVTIGGNFTVGGTGNLTFSNTGAVALGASRTITVTNSGTTAEFAQAFSGAFAINKAGAGTLILSGNNTNIASGVNPTYTGTGGGTMIFRGSNALKGIMQVGTGATSTFRIESDSGFSSGTAGIQSFGTGAFNLQVDRQTAGSGTGLNYNFTNGSAGAIDLATLATVNFSAGPNITSGTPTIDITSANGLRSQSANSGSNIITITANGVNVRANGMTAGSTGRTKNWHLGGTSTGNEIYGSMSDGANSFSLTKNGTGTWTLSGTNAYDLNTTVNQGILNTTKALALSAYNTSGRVVISGGTLGVRVGGAGWTTTEVDTMLTNATKTSGAIGIDTTNGNLTQWTTFAGAGNFGALGLNKLGSNTLTLDQANTYTGATNVNAGTLSISSSGSIANTTAVTVAAGAKFIYNSSTALHLAPDLNGSGSNKATFSGEGAVNAAMTLNSLDDVLSPGNSPGTQTFTPAQDWASFSYDWEVNNFTGTTAGTDFDQIILGSTLNLSGGSGAYQLNVLGLTAGDVGGLVPNFSEINRSWTILTSASTLTGFNAANCAINTGGFTDPDAGSWTLSQSGNNLVLNYTAIPEPPAALLGGLGLLMLLRRRR